MLRFLPPPQPDDPVILHRVALGCRNMISLAARQSQEPFFFLLGGAPFFFGPQREAAPLRPISVSCSAVRLRARALPPLLPITAVSISVIVFELYAYLRCWIDSSSRR